LAHVVVVEGIPKSIADHTIDVLHITHFDPIAQVRNVGAKGHIFLAASCDDVGVTQLNMLSAKSYGAKARTAYLIDTPC
jgi:hypothetical protein